MKKIIYKAIRLLMICSMSLFFLSGCASVSSSVSEAESHDVVDGESLGYKGYYTFTEYEGTSYFLIRVTKPADASISNSYCEFGELSDYFGDPFEIDGPDAELKIKTGYDGGAGIMEYVGAVNLAEGALEEFEERAQDITMTCDTDNSETVEITLTYVSNQKVQYPE